MNEYTTTNKDSTLEVSMNQLKEAIEQFCEHIYEATSIYILNPLDLIEIDMSEIPCTCYFISSPHINRGEMCQVDGDLKRELYKFIEEHPDRVFRCER